MFVFSAAFTVYGAISASVFVLFFTHVTLKVFPLAEADLISISSGSVKYSRISPALSLNVKPSGSVITSVISTAPTHHSPFLVEV